MIDHGMCKCLLSSCVCSYKIYEKQKPTPKYQPQRYYRHTRKQKIERVRALKQNDQTETLYSLNGCFLILSIS